MLPEQSLPMSPDWREMLEELAPVFAHRLLLALACGLILADRGNGDGDGGRGGDRAAVGRRDGPDGQGWARASPTG